MGVGLAVAILIDATIVRGVLLPATMKLLGDWNWYLPSGSSGCRALPTSPPVHPSGRSRNRPDDDSQVSSIGRPPPCPGGGRRPFGLRARPRRVRRNGGWVGRCQPRCATFARQYRAKSAQRGRLPPTQPAVASRRPRRTKGRPAYALPAPACGRTPSNLRAGFGQPPVPPPEEGTRCRHEHRAHDERVEQHAAAEAGRHIFTSTSGARGERGEREEHDQRRAGDQPPVLGESPHHGLVGTIRSVVLLPHPGQDEHLVVHRQPVDEGEHHQRRPRRRPRRWVGAQQRRVPNPRCQTSVILPQVANTDATFSAIAFSGRTIERKARAKQHERDQRDQPRSIIGNEP